MLRYPVKLEKDSNGTWLVIFPDVPQAHTYGDNREEALARSVDALETAFLGYVEDRRPIPRPKARRRGPWVTVPALTEAKLELYEAMRTGRISKAEMARRLNCHMPQVDRLLDLRHGSRLDQLEAAFRVLGKQLTVAIVAA